MHRNVFLVTLIVLISGCGGGSDSSSGSIVGGGSGGGNSSDPLQQYINVSSQYTGIKTAANLDKVAVSRFMSAITMLQPELLPSYDDEKANSTELCSDGGVAVFRPNSANTELAVSFTGCNDGGVVLNGEATFRVVRRNAAGDVIEGLMIYQDTVLSYDSAQFVLRGSVRQKDISSSCYAEQYLSNLLLSVQDSNEQWYFENFYDQRFGAFGLGCLSEGMQFQGRVYLSDVGFVNVTTPQLLKLPSMVYGLERQGHLALTGAAGQTFGWQFQKSGTDSQPIYSHHFSLTGDNAFAYQYRASIFNSQMMTDFRDSDGDGMSDPWELNFGFDPQNSADALTDQDGDGFSNLEEFTHLGDPRDVTILPFIYQLSVSLNHTPGRQSELVYVGTPISHTFGSDAYTVELHYKTELPFQISDQSYNCTLTNDRLEARCKIEYIQANTQYEHSVALEAPSSLINEIQAPITVSIHTPGLNTSLQTTATTVLSRQAAELNFKLTQPYPEAGTLVAVVGKQNTMPFRLYQSGSYDFVPGMRVKMIIPAELGDSSALCRQTADWQPCEQFDIIYSSTTTEIDIVFSPSVSGKGSGEIQLFAPDNAEPVAVWKFQIISGQPTSVLQQAIDSATDGIIIVPADIYVGGLDLSSKKIILEGENQQTFLIGKIDDEDDASSQVLLDKESEIKGFSFANLQIITGSAGAVLTSNRMAIPELLQPGSSILAYGSLTMRKNKFISTAFVNPFADQSYLDTCTGVYLHQKDTDLQYHFIFENNLLVTEGLKPYFCLPISINDGYVSRVEHNTVKDFDTFIAIGQYSNTIKSSLLIRNNAFVALEAVVSVNTFGEPPLQLEVLNNLFDQVEYPVRYAFIPYTMADNIIAEAGLDSLGTPLADSALVDAASVSEVRDDIFNNVRPVDGNNDGLVFSDIGAVERQN